MPESDDPTQCGHLTHVQSHGEIRASGQKLARLLSCIHFAAADRQHCHVGDQVSDCKMGSFQDASFAGHSHGSMSFSGGMLCIFL